MSGVFEAPHVAGKSRPHAFTKDWRSAATDSFSPDSVNYEEVYASYSGELISTGKSFEA